MDHPRIFGPRRELGHTSFVASQLGIGDLADRSIAFDECVATVRRAIQAGLNVIDTAPGYEDGYSERIVGEAVKGSRDSLFVIDKIDHHDQHVRPQIEESLQRLTMERTDAFVFHGLSSMEVLRSQLSPGGGFDQLRECIRAGLTRFGGVSSHDPDVLRAAIEAGVCDIVMFPVGPYVDNRYISDVLPLAKSRGVGTVCFKTFGAGKLMGDTAGYNQPLRIRPRGKVSSGGEDAVSAELPRLSVSQCLHYTLTLDPDVALLGLSFPNEQDEAFAAAQLFTPLHDTEMEEIRQLAAVARREKGPCWWNPHPDL